MGFVCGLIISYGYIICNRKAVAVFKAVLHNALKAEGGEGCGGAALAVKKLGLRKNEAKQSKTEDGNTENNGVYYIFDLSIHLSLPP